MLPIKTSITSKGFKLALLLVVLFLIIRLPGLSLPYHQDETKTALISSLGAEASSDFYHPPLTQLLYRAENVLLGPDYFRVFTLIFALLGAILALIVAKRCLGSGGALFTLFLLSIGVYSVHASLMLDTDGAILPLFFLLAVHFYDRAYEEAGRKRQVFSALLFLALL